MPISLLLSIATLLLFALYRLLKIGQRPKDAPPGPPTLPILGNLHQLSINDAHLQLQRWAEEYGPLYTLMLGTRLLIVISKDTVVKDLLDKKSAIYSSRPDFHVAQAVGSGGYRLVLMPYGSTWRMQRKIVHNAVNVNKAIDYIPYQELENKQLLNDLLSDDDHVLEHLRRFSSSIITSVAYGFRWSSAQDPLLLGIMKGLDDFVELNGAIGAALGDFFPILRSIPTSLNSVKQAATAHHEKELSQYKSLWLKAKDDIVKKSSSAKACACMDIVEAQKEEGFSDEFAAYLASVFFEAGSETTSTELYGFIQALLLYPEVQARGHAELDTVIGNQRMPTLEDMPNLPWVRACVKETLRWLPAAIIGGVPHSTTEDDIYNGYKIPKGASIILNVWSLHRDPDRYARPERFEPERFLGDETHAAESANLADVTQRDHFGFGAGRRLCPGTHIAERSMLLAISRIFWAFDVQPKTDENLQKLWPIQDEFLQGAVAMPKKYEVSFTPRSDEKAKVVKDAWNEAKTSLDATGQWINNPI